MISFEIKKDKFLVYHKMLHETYQMGCQKTFHEYFVYSI